MGIFSGQTSNELDSNYQNIENCASCGEDHTQVLVKELVVPITIDGKEHNGMYFCPETGDSIYIKVPYIDDFFTTY